MRWPQADSNGTLVSACDADRRPPSAAVRPASTSPGSPLAPDYLTVMLGAEPVRVDAEGYLTVPAAPGLGAQIDPAAVARYARCT